MDPRDPRNYGDMYKHVNPVPRGMVTDRATPRDLRRRHRRIQIMLYPTDMQFLAYVRPLEQFGYVVSGKGTGGGGDDDKRSCIRWLRDAWRCSYRKWNGTHRSDR